VTLIGILNIFDDTVVWAGVGTPVGVSDMVVGMEGIAVGIDVATGAQAESETLKNIKMETSALRVFIFSPLTKRFLYLHTSTSQSQKADISRQNDKLGSQTLELKVIKL